MIVVVLPLRAGDAVLLWNRVVVVDETQREAVRVELHTLLLAPAVPVEIGRIRPVPVLLAIGLERIEGVLPFYGDHLEDRAVVSWLRSVVLLLVLKRPGAAPDAFRTSRRVRAVRDETEHPHEAGASDFGEDLVVAGIVTGERRIEILDLQLVWL